MYDLLLKNAWVVDPLNSVNGVADVAIQDGKIAKVQRDITEEAKEVIDFTGKTLQPGLWITFLTTSLNTASALTWRSCSSPPLLLHSKMPIPPSRK